MNNNCGTKDSLCNLLKPMCIFYQLRDPLLSSSYGSFTHLPSSEIHTQTSNENSGENGPTAEPSQTSTSAHHPSFLFVHQLNNSNGHPFACEALQQILKKLRSAWPEEINPLSNTSEELNDPWDIIEAMGTGGQRGGGPRSRKHPALPHRRYSVPEAVMRRYSLSRLGNTDPVPILPSKMNVTRGGPPHLDSPSRSKVRSTPFGTPKLSRKPIIPPLNLSPINSETKLNKKLSKDDINMSNDDEILQNDEKLTIETTNVTNENVTNNNNNSIIIITSNYDNPTDEETPADVSTTSTDSKHIQTEAYITKDASTCYQAPTPPISQREERRVSFAENQSDEEHKNVNPSLNNPLGSPFLGSPAEDTGSMTLCLSSTTTEKTTSRSSVPVEEEEGEGENGAITPWQPMPTSSSLDDGSEKWTPRENAFSSTTQEDSPRSDDRNNTSSSHSPVSSSHYATKSHSLPSSANSATPVKCESDQTTPRQQISPRISPNNNNNNNNNFQSRSRNFTSIFQPVPEEEPLNRQSSPEESKSKTEVPYETITNGMNRPVGIYHTSFKETQNIWRREDEEADETDKMSQHSWSSGWQLQTDENSMKNKVNLKGGSHWMKNNFNDGIYTETPPSFAQRFVVMPQECQPKWNGTKMMSETYRWSQRSDEERYVIRKQQKQRYAIEKRLLVDNLPPTPQRENFSTIVTGSTYERCPREAPLIVPRFSALPRSMSMLVNTSSGDGSSEATESDCSLLDSLEGDDHISTTSINTIKSNQSEPIRRPWSGNLKSESFYIPIERHTTPPPPPVTSSRPPSANTSFFVPINDTGQVPSVNVVSVLPPKLRARLARRHEHLLEEARNRQMRDHERPSSGFYSSKRKRQPKMAIKVATKDSERARPRHDPGRLSHVEIPPGQDSVIIDVHARLESPTDSEKHAERILLASVRASLTPVPQPNSPKHRQYKLVTPPPGNNDEEILLNAISTEFREKSLKTPPVRDLRLETPPFQEISDVERPSDNNVTTRENTDYEDEQTNETKIIRVSPEGENTDTNLDFQQKELQLIKLENEKNQEKMNSSIEIESNLKINNENEEKQNIIENDKKSNLKKNDTNENKLIRTEKKKSMHLPLNMQNNNKMKEGSKIPSPKKLVSPRGSGIPVLLPGASVKNSREKITNSKSRLPVRQSSLRRTGGSHLQRFRQQFDAIPEERSSVSLESPPDAKLKKERVNTETKRASEKNSRDENVNILNTGAEMNMVPKRPGAAGRYRGGKAALAQTSTDHGGELAALSRGWINFYLLGEGGGVGGNGSIDKSQSDQASQESPRYGKMLSSNERLLPELRHGNQQISPKTEVSGEMVSSEIFSSSETTSTSSMELERARFRNRRQNQQVRSWNNRRNRVTPLSSATSPASTWSVTVASAGAGLAVTAPASLEMRLTFPTPSGVPTTTTTTSTTTSNAPPPPVTGNTSDSGLGEDKDGVHPFRIRDSVLPPPTAPHRLTYTVRNQGSVERLRTTTHKVDTNVLPELRGEAKRCTNFEKPTPLTAPPNEMKFSNSIIFSDDLSVKGAAITPERKPRVPTMTERDLTGRYLEPNYH